MFSYISHESLLDFLFLILHLTNYKLASAVEYQTEIILSSIYHIKTILIEIVPLRDHPFNLKEGAMVFSESNFFSLHGAAEIYCIRHKVLSEYFFLPVSEIEILFPSNLLTNFFSNKQQHYSLWMFPYEIILYIWGTVPLVT